VMGRKAMIEFPRPSWKPDIVPSIAWTVGRLQKYLQNKQFTVFENGSCVVWPGSERLIEQEAVGRLNAVVTHHPDFKVRRHSDGNFLVTFRGGVGGVMSGDILRDNLSVLRKDAFGKGLLPSEIIEVDSHEKANDMDFIAGLYVRARLYIDVDSPVVVSVA